MRTYRPRDLLLVPSLISAARVPLALAFPSVVRRPALGFAVLAAAALSDVLDGSFARRRGEVTPIGAVVDGVADKVFAASVLGTLVRERVIGAGSALLLASRELIELPIGIWLLGSPEARAVPVRRHANALGKAATVMQFVSVVATYGAFVSRRRRPLARGLFIGATSALGVAAAVSYWERELRASRPRLAPPSVRPAPWPSRARQASANAP